MFQSIAPLKDTHHAAATRQVAAPPVVAETVGSYAAPLLCEEK